MAEVYIEESTHPLDTHLDSLETNSANLPAPFCAPNRVERVMKSVRDGKGGKARVTTQKQPPSERVQLAYPRGPPATQSSHPSHLAHSSSPMSSTETTPPTYRSPLCIHLRRASDVSLEKMTRSTEVGKKVRQHLTHLTHLTISPITIE